MKKIFILILALCALLACRQQNKQNQTKEIVYTVAEKKLTDQLYFSGTIEPLKIVSVAAPEEGVVVEKNFEYGQFVNKSQLLIKLDSDKLERDFNAALTDFLTAKDKLTSTRTDLDATQALSKLGVISGDELRQATSNYNNANVSYLQALNKFQHVAKLSPADFTLLTELTISNIPEINKAMHANYNFLNITAPERGVALVPIKSEESKETGIIALGTTVKAGQIVTSIGDLTGLSASININEVDINQIKPGQLVTLTGVGFPEFALKGSVSQVASQALVSASGLGNIPTFTAKVIVPKLTAEQQKFIRVGMSAKIQITIEHPNRLLIPIDAVYEKEGKSWVTRIVNEKKIETPVTTGETTFNDVEVLNGLKSGDKIIYAPRNIVKLP